MSGSVTISISAAPARFRSIKVNPVSGSCDDFAVSCSSLTSSVSMQIIREVERVTNLFELNLLYPHMKFLIRFRIPHFDDTPSRQRSCTPSEISFHVCFTREMTRERTIFLSNLKSRWEIWIKVVLPIEARSRIDRGSEREGGEKC